MIQKLNELPFSILDQMIFDLDLDEEQNHEEYDILIKEYFRRLEE